MSNPDTTAARFRPLLELEKTAADQFEGPRAPENGDRTFGGQFLAQSAAAAALTVDDNRIIHSLHAYFLRPGDVAEPTIYRVDRVRDGRSFSLRMVTAHQNGKELFRMTTSFHVPEDGDSYTHPTMPDVPPPEAAPMTYAEFNRQVRPPDAERWAGEDRPMDLQYVNPALEPRGEPVLENQRIWMRIPEPLDDNPNVHAAAMAYLSDSTLVDHVLLPHGERWQDPRFGGASLDHAMWFHRAARADEWLLFDQAVESTGHGRGLATGRLFTADGRLAATCSQEGLIRWNEPPGPTGNSQ